MFLSPGLLAALLFFSFLMVVALVLVIMLLRDRQIQQKVYANFAGHLDEFLVTLSKDGRLLDASPQYLSDPLFELICQKKSFKKILSASEYRRLQDYMRGLDAYPEIPFIFSIGTELGVRWYELRAYIQKRGGDSNTVLLLKNVSLDMETKTQRDRLQEKVDLLLQTTGDFLWSMEVDSRRFSFMTPLMDVEGNVVPRSVGVRDLHTIMPEQDYAYFERYLNTKIVEFRKSGHDSAGNSRVRLRIIGDEDKPEWFGFCGKLCSEENSKMVIRGSARRLDWMFDDTLVNGSMEWGDFVSNILAFPDVRVFLVDRDYKICGCNQAFSLAFGMSLPEELQGKRLLEVVRPKYFFVFHRVLSDVFERGVPKSWKGPFGVGDKLLWFNAVPLKNQDGHTSRILGIYMQLERQEFENKNNNMEIL